MPFGQVLPTNTKNISNTTKGIKFELKPTKDKNLNEENDDSIIELQKLNIPSSKIEVPEKPGSKGHVLLKRLSEVSSESQE